MSEYRYANASPLLRVEQLNIAFPTRTGPVQVVSDLSYTLAQGEIMGVVGESGCGKSVSTLALPGLLSDRAIIEAERICFHDKNLLTLPDEAYVTVRGKEISMIFQEPMTSLNPLIKAGKQVSEMLLLHTDISEEAARAQVIDMFEQVGLRMPEQVYNAYPHTLSGGMLQRVMIAMAMICKPALLLADEPTTALDVTIQTQILHLMKELSKAHKTSILLISHDLGVIGEICDSVLVMYLGYCVEKGSVDAILSRPAHPYTVGLTNAIPDIHKRGERLYTIPGTVPSMDKRPKGCPFSTRCEFADDRCRTSLPPLTHIAADHAVRCYYPLSDAAPIPGGAHA